MTAHFIRYVTNRSISSFTFRAYYRRVITLCSIMHIFVLWDGVCKQESLVCSLEGFLMVFSCHVRTMLIHNNTNSAYTKHLVLNEYSVHVTLMLVAKQSILLYPIIISCERDSVFNYCTHEDLRLEASMLEDYTSRVTC